MAADTNKRKSGDKIMSTERYTFGPVPSRRLGLSLGVDLVPLKTCTYDCLYCQLGRTSNKTVERKEWVPMDAVAEDLKARLHTRPDYITLSGSGEPTLYSRLGEMIERIHAMTSIPVVVLTNGSLLWDKAMRDEIRAADLVIPSLDAGDAQMFSMVNRPHDALGFEQMLEGLIAFRQEYGGFYWLEVLLLGGYTALAGEVDKLARCVKKIKPDRVQLNTVTRPPAEDYAVLVEQNRMQKFAARFEPAAEVIADFAETQRHAAAGSGHADILHLLERRPCTAGDIAAGLGLHRNEVAKHLEAGMAQGELKQRWIKGEAYYHPAASLTCASQRSPDACHKP